MACSHRFYAAKGMDVEIYHSSSIDGVVGPYNRDLARARLDAGEVVVLTGGTGNPFYDRYGSLPQGN